MSILQWALKPWKTLNAWRCRRARRERLRQQALGIFLWRHHHQPEQENRP